MLLTGGHNKNGKTVSVYGEDGWRSYFKPMKETRFWHGCTSFISKGKKVPYKNYISLLYNKIKLNFKISC